MSFQALITTNSLDPAEVELLRTSGIDFQIEGVDLTAAALERALEGKDAYILGGVENVAARTLEGATDLRVVAFLGVGYNAFIDADAATRLGIAIANAPGSNARAVAEFAIGLMIDAVRHTTSLANATKAGRWPEFRSCNLYGRTLAVFGMGTIGRIVAEIAHCGFGMAISYHSRVRKPDVEERLGATYCSFEDLLARADVLSIHASYGPDTHGVFDATALAHLREGAVIVNASEAELIDGHALRSAIEDGQLGCVAMDGYYIEPVPTPVEDPYGLLGLPDDRCLVLPHTSFNTSESVERALAMNLSSIRNVLDTGHDEHIVNPAFRDAARWLPAARATPV